MRLGDSYLDTRDIERRIADLQRDKDTLQSAMDELQEDDLSPEELSEAEDNIKDYMSLFDWDAREELRVLTEFKEELEPYCDWLGGETLIHEDAFLDYMKEFHAETDRAHNNWPYNHIDWDAAAEEFKADFTCADTDGGTYYVRTY